MHAPRYTKFIRKTGIYVSSAKHIFKNLTDIQAHTPSFIVSMAFILTQCMGKKCTQAQQYLNIIKQMITTIWYPNKVLKEMEYWI